MSGKEIRERAEVADIKEFALTRKEKKEKDNIARIEKTRWSKRIAEWQRWKEKEKGDIEKEDSRMIWPKEKELLG